MTSTNRAAPATTGLIRPFQTFFEQETAGSILLLICTGTALIWANSPLAAAYERLWGTVLTVGVGQFVLAKSLHHWINDGLMALFFFVVGLEIKRELLVGELSKLQKAALPVAGAIGGMIVPAASYALLNLGTPAISGWGVPMATDIAFALGILALLGPRVPAALKVFLAALAIADDLGAVIVIAVFYTSDLAYGALAVAAAAFAAMLAVNRAGVRRPLVYAILGSILWLAVLKSGVHATIAGVLAAIVIPAMWRIDPRSFARRSRSLLDSFETDLDNGLPALTGDQRDVVVSLEAACESVESPLARFERALHPWVAFAVMPLFAFSNAGVVLDSGTLASLTDPVAIGIILGLVAGKQLGVVGFAWLAVRAGFAALPEGVTWRALYGVSCLCGIGFTMSLFVADLAFADAPTLTIAKTGILAASVVSGVWGWVVLRGAPSARIAGEDGSSRLT